MSAQNVPQIPLFINGKKVSSKSTNLRNVVNPATQEVLAVVPFATIDEVNQAVESAREAFKTWSQITGYGLIPKEKCKMFKSYEDAAIKGGIYELMQLQTETYKFLTTI